MPDMAARCSVSIIGFCMVPPWLLILEGIRSLEVRRSVGTDHVKRREYLSASVCSY